MTQKAHELQEIISDLTSIKEALAKSGSIFRFIDAGGILKSVLLLIGIFIGIYATAFHFLLEHYGTFTEIPLQIRCPIWILLLLSILFIGYLKTKRFLQGARLIRSDINLYKLLEESYTPQLLAVVLPHTITIILVAVFLFQNEMTLYLVPIIAFLFGLLYVSLSMVFYMREIYLLGLWLVATGLLTLFTAAYLSSLAMMGITFSAGFILAAVYLYANLPGEKR